MDPLADSHRKTKEQVFRHLYDQRPQHLRDQHHQLITSLYSRNLKNLNIQITKKQKIEYSPAELLRQDLGDGWFANITDNFNLKAQHTIITVHGCPGDHREWAGLEKELSVHRSDVRWINLVVPGFDGLDQRRGTYSGTIQDLSLLIVRLLKKKSIKQFVFCGHSMGSIFSSYFINHFPQYIAGSISVTGVVDTWYIGLISFYNFAVISSGLNRPGVNLKEVFTDPQKRKHFRDSFNSRGRESHFDGVKFPQLSQSEAAAYIKLVGSSPNGLSTAYQLNRQLRSLRVYIYGQLDTIQENEKTEQMFVNKCFAPLPNPTNPPHPFNYTYQLNQAQKTELEKKLAARHPDVKFDYDNVQSNFVFNFEDTGHNAHKRRPKEIAKIVDIYLSVIQVAPIKYLHK